ncbi:hypothetical protein ACJJTC_009979 [Scirpophaga incertulas]
MESQVSQVKLPPNFDIRAPNVGTEWRLWKLSFEDYLIGMGQEQASDKVKLSLLRNMLGMESTRIILTLPTSVKDACNYEKVMASSTQELFNCTLRNTSRRELLKTKEQLGKRNCSPEPPPILPSPEEKSTKEPAQLNREHLRRLLRKTPKGGTAEEHNCTPANHQQGGLKPQHSIHETSPSYPPNTGLPGKPLTPQFRQPHPPVLGAYLILLPPRDGCSLNPAIALEVPHLETPSPRPQPSPL